MNPRIYVFYHPNKTIVIKNNLKEKDMRVEKLKIVRKLKFYYEIDCVLQ